MKLTILNFQEILSELQADMPAHISDMYIHACAYVDRMGDKPNKFMDMALNEIQLWMIENNFEVVEEKQEIITPELIEIIEEKQSKSIDIHDIKFISPNPLHQHIVDLIRQKCGFDVSGKESLTNNECADIAADSKLLFKEGKVAVPYQPGNIRIVFSQMKGFDICKKIVLENELMTI